LTFSEFWTEFAPGKKLGGATIMIANLQMLRGLAALAVVFYHTDYRLPGDVHTEFQGVAVFFVISGFIMTHITRQDASSFLTHRLIRIVPLYWLCTIAIAVLAHADVAAVAKSLLFIPYWNINHDPQPLLGVGWTLNMEMFFYGLFALALLASRRWAPVIAGTVIVAIVAVKKHYACETIVCAVYGHDYVALFPAGIVVYYVWMALRGRAEHFPLTTMLIGAMIAAVFLAWQLQILSPLTSWDSKALPALIVLAALSCESAGWRTGGWALFLGNISYALYLTHPFVIELTRYGIDFKQSIWAVLAMLTVSIAVAAGAYHLFERPVTALLRGRRPFPRIWSTITPEFRLRQ